MLAFAPLFQPALEIERAMSALVSGGRTPADLAMDRYAAGDDAAFAEVYDAVAPRLYAYLRKQTRDAALAEDVLQQTLLKMHLARGSFLSGAPEMPWAYAIARRLYVDNLRRGRREVLATTDEPRETEVQAGEPTADELVAASQLAVRLEAELARLPEAQRTAFALVKQEGLSMAEAASVLGTTVSAVKLRAFRAYQTLRSALGDLLPKDLEP